MRYVLILLLGLLPHSVLAANRMALVIGNDSYSDVPVLEKAGADARAVSEKLRGLGFDTVEAIDQDRRGMNSRISEFTSKLQPGDTAFVFYAGHGVEIDGENYLLPTDIIAPSGGESDFVKSESIALSDLLDRVRKTGARTAIAVIDACRDNPFETAQGRSIGGTRGLGRIAAPQGTFVIFSAGAGQMALDRLHDGDEAQNSVFTRALLPRLSKPGLELRALVSDLRIEVRDLASSVQHRQVPAYYDELLGEFYFTNAAVAAPVASALPDTGMRADLELARSVGTVNALDSFLNRYKANADDYSYTVALQLRESLAQADTAPVSRQADTETVEVAADPVVTDQRNVMRDTQVALNALGCSAGGADGVAGPRTRRAFGAYLRDSGSDLGADDLGTAHALEELQGHNGTICKVAVAPTPALKPKTTTLSMAGTWNFKATCALLVKVTGQVRYTRAGGNKYNGKLADSLGQKANTVIYLNESQLSGTDYFPGITVTWRGRLAPDGNSFTANGSTGCAVYAWRVG
ncbi:caspase family protein [Ruegeria sp. 2012CJ41-6]|uniref:Caspase family protein n=1 Tax=Ruegeria spongiae TaxID=2942209 RepID=A0ABT0PWT1_9RHOB|nr:caspase family protein [Ruegeria spongiae]MCL6282045.1 caspase family protein [Ruegeria spongiae]